MNSGLGNESSSAPHIRRWPGVALVATQWLIWLGLPVVAPDATPYAFGAALFGGLLTLFWWLFFSRVPLLERWGALLLMLLAGAAMLRWLHPSVATGMMGLMIYFYAVPSLSLALVAWAFWLSGHSLTVRRILLALCILSACGFWLLIRTEGIYAAGRSQLAWRWTMSPEDRLAALAPVAVPKPALPAQPETAGPGPVEAPKKALPFAEVPEWPGFRGAQRDGVARGTRIATDWASAPPDEMWRRAVGPAWSSFAVQGGLIYTQEQRGEDEVVACYRLQDGQPVWTHRDAVRFWESNAGAGPRGTPSLHSGRIYSFGATGRLNALRASDGALMWQRDAAADTGEKVPDWGFSSSPLVLEDLVLVAASSHLVAYELETGKLRWAAPTGKTSYSSPHLLALGGVPQVLLLSNDGVTSVAPAGGGVLWKHEWGGFTALQPALTPEGALLVTTSGAAGGLGTRSLAVTRKTEGWTVEERWTSRGLKPYFNDLVVHRGHAYGFDGGILSCIELAEGQRKWKGGRYGHGQMLLLKDQDMLLVLSEEGEVALVAATPAEYREVARFRALEGKTWNHPVLVGSTLLVRNSEEMAAFRLPVRRN